MRGRAAQPHHSRLASLNLLLSELPSKLLQVVYLQLLFFCFVAPAAPHAKHMLGLCRRVFPNCNITTPFSHRISVSSFQHTNKLVEAWPVLHGLCSDLSHKCPSAHEDMVRVTLQVLDGPEGCAVVSLKHKCPLQSGNIPAIFYSHHLVPEAATGTPPKHPYGVPCFAGPREEDPLQAGRAPLVLSGHVSALVAPLLWEGLLVYRLLQYVVVTG